MRRATLARELIEAPDRRSRSKLLSRFRHLADERLAAELRKACYAAWTVSPVRAQRAEAAARLLAAAAPQPIIKATAAWLRGISDITKGKFEAALLSLNEAAAILTERTDAAQVQVARLLALAMLSRYEESVKAGRKALKIFVETDDQLAAGKIEMNLSNVVARQGRSSRSEKYGLSALARFIKVGEKKWQAMAENSLANTYADLNQLNKAEKYYRRALHTAHGEKMAVTEAEIEASLGNLATLRGRYAVALRYLESSRQRYEELAMPHQSAIADLEIGDIYLELNLLAEAVDIYSRVARVFARLKMRAEEARTRLEYGRALAKLDDPRTAKRELARSLKLFAAEKNIPAQASVLLSQAELALTSKRQQDAAGLLHQASAYIREGGTSRQAAFLGLMAGRALAAAGNLASAQKTLIEAADKAKKHQQPAVLHASYDALARLALAAGETRKAKQFFGRSIEIIEQLRSPFGADEFGVAFFGSRLGSYQGLAKLQLDEGLTDDAFSTIERGRSRALLDALAGRRRSGGPSQLVAHADQLRAELNSLYKTAERTSDDPAALRDKIARTEKELQNTHRKIISLRLPEQSKGGAENTEFAVRSIQAALADRTLVEFVEFDGQISAFVVSKSQSRYVKGLGTSHEVSALLEELHFQFGTLRYGGAMSRFAAQLKGRADALLGRLYDMLVRPLEGGIDSQKMVVVPTGPLHYVPFAALHDGRRYLAERFELVSASSAAIWRELLHRKGGKIHSSLLIAHADERIPLVENEVVELSRVVPDARTLTGKNATFRAFAENAGRHELIHIACHGQFRRDNPMYSSLHLADGWITVHDLTSQRLRAKLVTLSACETGLSEVLAGDELLGLARGFLAAGASSLLVSLWTVNDGTAIQLMTKFYNSLQRGRSPAASLSDAQMELIGSGAHPYLWAPFILVGR